ncbi:MAG TPA: post-COAP-1 domain-containing protein [Vicinamibacteria bacterium]|jgi:hypothetical protein
MRRSIVFTLVLGGVVLAAFALTRSPARAQFVPEPCDFITGGGFVFTDDLARANFGAHGGCKNGEFWGHVNYVDHGGFMGQTPYHVDSTQITGYVTVPGSSNARDICGVARTNAGETVNFRVRMEDNGEGPDDPKDRFGIRLSNNYLVTTRPLGDGEPGGGNVKLHKDNPSTRTPPDEAAVCDVGVPEPEPTTPPSD